MRMRILNEKLLSSYFCHGMFHLCRRRRHFFSGHHQIFSRGWKFGAEEENAIPMLKIETHMRAAGSNQQYNWKFHLWLRVKSTTVTSKANNPFHSAAKYRLSDATITARWHNQISEFRQNEAIKKREKNVSSMPIFENTIGAQQTQQIGECGHVCVCVSMRFPVRK